MALSPREYAEECNMLDGNLARLKVTGNIKELNSMYAWAVWRINRIYQTRYAQLLQKQKST